MSENDPTFWFPVKRYGWGWGAPVRWQGWVVLAAYLALVYFGISTFKTQWSTTSMFAYLGLLTAAFIGVVAIKGERPVGWRWGKK